MRKLLLIQLLRNQQMKSHPFQDLKKILSLLLKINRKLYKKRKRPVAENSFFEL